MYSSLFCNAACDSNFRYGIKDTVYPEAGAVWMRNRISVESDRENGRCISGAGSGKTYEERKSEDGIKMCRSDSGIGRTDHHCNNAYQYADPGTDRKYPESYLYASAQINQLVKQVNHIQLDDSAMTTILKNAMNEASTSLQNWMRTDLLDKVNELMTHLTVGLYTLVMELFHAVIGVIVSVYILFGKETFINQSKK